MNTPPTQPRPEDRPKQPQRGMAWRVLQGLAVLLFLLGLAMAGLGTWLVSLDGSMYFVVAGVVMLAAAGVVFAGRPAWGVTLYAAVVVATVIWALWEIAAKGWMPAWGVDFASRVGVLLGLLVLMTLAFAWMPRPPQPAHSAPTRMRRGPVVAGLALLALAVAVPVGLTRWAPALAQPATPFAQEPAAATVQDSDIPEPAWDARAPGSERPAMGRAAAAPDADEWTAYGGSNLGQRFAQATQITPENVGQLEPAWTFRTGDMAPNDRVFFAFQNTPLKIGDS